MLDLKELGRCATTGDVAIESNLSRIGRRAWRTETLITEGRGTENGGKGLLNVSPLSIRRPSLSFRGGDSKGRSVVGIRGEPKEGPDIKDSLGTGFKIRSQGFVETGRLGATAARRWSLQTFSQGRLLTTRIDLTVAESAHCVLWEFARCFATTDYLIDVERQSEDNRDGQKCPFSFSFPLSFLSSAIATLISDLRSAR